MANPPLRDQLTVIGALLVDMALVLSLAISFFACFVSILDGLGVLIAHYAFGESWAWVRAHFMGNLLLWSLVAIPILWLAGMVWTSLRDEYP